MSSKQVLAAQIAAALLVAYGGLKWYEREKCLEVYGEKMCIIHDYDLKKLEALKALWSR